MIYSTKKNKIMAYALHIKEIPLQAWRAPEGSRKLRFPDFMTTAQGGGKVVSLTPFWLADQGTVIRFLTGAFELFFSLQCPEWLLGPLASYPVVIRSSRNSFLLGTVPRT